MKITSFHPFIETAHADETIRLFEEMGFEKRTGCSCRVVSGTCTGRKR